MGELGELQRSTLPISVDLQDVSEDKAPKRHRRSRTPKVSPSGILFVITALAATWVVAQQPGLRWVIYASWMLPLVELLCLTAGQASFRWRFREAPTGKFTQAIIQITTTGREYARVTEIIDQIRSYNLKMDYQIWVVLEPGYPDEYPFADRVLVVPVDFSARSEKKARALEFSRQARQSIGLDRDDVKIIFNDDDVSLTQSYIETAFTADYDICEGIVTPRTAYAMRPLGHFLTSHADDIRTHACLVYCSVFQGLLGRPLHVHGEGLVVTGQAEGLVTWDWPIFASEDLVFGYHAARIGLRWGWFHEYAEVTSPWGLRDFLIQRQRWLWGDIHAIGHRKVMSLFHAAIVTGKYMSVAALVWSVAGLYLWLTGAIPATSTIFDYAKLSVLAWVTVLFACGWIGASSSVSPRGNDSRLMSGVLAVLMMPASVTLTLAATIIPLMQGNPRTFKVISKTRSTR
jgi:Glycosyl transferase family group 2